MLLPPLPTPVYCNTTPTPHPRLLGTEEYTILESYFEILYVGQKRDFRLFTSFYPAVKKVGKESAKR